MLIQPIHTPRLLIRQFETRDWQAFHTYTSDPEVMKFIPEGPFSKEQARQVAAANSGEQAEIFPVILIMEDRLIGHMAFHPWFAPQTYELGWVIHPEYQGRGYATEAAGALLRYAFEDLKCHRVVATCQPENPASYRVMEKLGMRREGHYQKCIYREGGTWWDELFYAILEEEYLPVKSDEH